MPRIHLFRSLKHALRGVKKVFQTELNFRLQVFASLLVLVFIFIFPLRSWEIVVLILLIGLVLILELINSIFERLVDAFRPRIHPIVKDIKDIMAGAVLLSAVIAAIIGLLIFWPHFVNLADKLI